MTSRKLQRSRCRRLLDTFAAKKLHQAVLLKQKPLNRSQPLLHLTQQAILSKQRAETLSSVLYPDDRTYEGKELRLKQQHFFVSATIQDVVRRYKDAHPDDWEKFPDKVGSVKFTHAAAYAQPFFWSGLGVVSVGAVGWGRSFWAAPSTRQRRTLGCASLSRLPPPSACNTPNRLRSS